MSPFAYCQLVPNRDDGRLIRRIVGRAKRNHPNLVAGNPLALELDLSICHLNGCPLHLRGLLEANNFDFVHDVGGIVLHLDRATGKLQDHFSPRYAQVYHPEVA